MSILSGTNYTAITNAAAEGTIFPPLPLRLYFHHCQPSRQLLFCLCLRLIWLVRLLQTALQYCTCVRERGGGGGGRERERDIVRQTETDRQTDRQRGRQTDKQTDRQTETDRQTDKQTDRQTDRQREPASQPAREREREKCGGLGRGRNRKGEQRTGEKL